MAKKTTTQKKGKKIEQHIPTYFKVLTVLVIIGSAYASVRLADQSLWMAFIAAFVFGAALLVLKNIFKAERDLKERAQKALEKKNKKKK